MFYDNSVDVIFDEGGSHSNNRGNNNNSFQTLAASNKAEPPLHQAVAIPLDTSSSKLLVSSQTWPLVAERKSVPYNAHTGCCKDIKRSGDDGDVEHCSTKSNSEDSSSSSSRHLVRSTDQQQEPATHDSGKILSASNTPAYKGSNSKTLPTPGSRSVNINTSQPCTLKQSSTQTSYPGVLYTNLNSPSAARSSLFSAFKPKNKRRRKDDASSTDCNKSDRDETSGYSINKPRESCRLYNSENVFSNPYTIYGASNNNVNFMYASDVQGTQRAPEPLSLGIAKDESLPFAEVGHLYGSVGHNFDSENCQMIPLSEIRRSFSNERLQFHCVSEQGDSLDVSSGRKESSICDQRCRDIKSSEHRTNVEREAEISSTDPLTPSPHHAHQQNIVISIPERSRLNIISKNPGKIRAASNRTGSSKQVSPSRQTPESPSKSDKLDTMSTIRDFQTPDYNTDPSGCTESEPAAQISELTKTESKDLDISSESNIGDKGQHEADLSHSNNATTLAHDSDISTNISTNISTANTRVLQVPRLRDLDHSLVFHSSKRNLE